MTKQERKRLKELLLKVALPKDQGGEGGWIPDECLGEFHKLTVTPYYELILHRNRGEADEFADEFLVQYRDDKDWRGHHVPGGMLKPGYPENPVGIAQALIDREFRGLGLIVTAVRMVAAYKWPVHPWSNPSVNVLLVEFDGEVPETEGRRWITAATMPEDMLPNHGMYIKQCEYFLNSMEALTFTPGRPYGIPED